jgi:Holliday junction resolvase RusA-like endonuclease
MYMTRQVNEKQPAGQLQIAIKIPLKTRGDASNYIKAPEDYLVSRLITADDRHNWRVSCEKADVDCCVVEILPYTPQAL